MSIRRFVTVWQLCNTPFSVLAERYRLLSKNALRCAYDLRHVVAFIQDKEMQEMFSERTEMWIKILDPTGNKNYRDELHLRIYELESKNEKLKKILEENGLYDDEIPF